MSIVKTSNYLHTSVVNYHGFKCNLGIKLGHLPTGIQEHPISKLPVAKRGSKIGINNGLRFA